MLERILENWLDKASEKSFQLPFCFMLAKEGHTIIHLTRHNLMEYGKDVVTIGPDGAVNAYQLKGAPGGRIGYDKYRSEILPQLNTLTGIPVTHPSVPQGLHHSYFVTNGNLEESVAVAMESANQVHIAQGRPELAVKTIVRGQLLEMAKRVQLEFLPDDLKNFNLFLELYLEEGGGMLPKEKLARLLERLYHPAKAGAREKRELIGSVAILIALAISNFSNQQNRLAEVEAWTMYIAYTFRFIEMHQLNVSHYKVEIALAHEAIVHALDELFTELSSTPESLYPHGPEENLLYHARLTWLSGFLAYFGIHLEKTGEHAKAAKVAAYLADFEHLVDPYGEAAMAPLLTVYWFQRMRDATLKPQQLLQQLFNTAIAQVERQNLSSSHFLPSPYYSIDECLADRYRKEKLIPDSKFESYYAEPLMMLIVRDNLKQFVRFQWPAFSRLHQKSFRFKVISDFYCWRCDQGDEVTRLVRTGDWTELREAALITDEAATPALLRTYPEWIPLLLLVYPHRIQTETLKLVDVWIRDRKRTVAGKFF